MSTTDLGRRLGVLEVVLGVDPEVVCQGPSEECPECDGHCPLRNNNVQRLSELLNQTLDELLQTRCWAEELEAAGAVPAGSWERAGTRRRLMKVEARLHLKQALQERLGSVGGSTLGDQLRHQIGELLQEQARLQQHLAKVEG
jgi:hypothetical protein